MLITPISWIYGHRLCPTINYWKSLLTMHITLCTMSATYQAEYFMLTFSAAWTEAPAFKSIITTGQKPVWLAMCSAVAPIACSCLKAPTASLKCCTSKKIMVVLMIGLTCSWQILSACLFKSPPQFTIGVSKHAFLCHVCSTVFWNIRDCWMKGNCLEWKTKQYFVVCLWHLRHHLLVWSKIT